MPDTQRTKNTLLTTLFQEGQSAGAITPQDMRDLIVSLIPSSGAARFVGDAVFNTVTPGTFVDPTTGTTEMINATFDVTMPVNGRVTYVGNTPRHFNISVSISADVVGNNQDLSFQLLKSGVAIPETLTSRTWGGGNDTGHLTIVTGLVLQPNDYITLQATNNTSTGAITISAGAITLHGHIF